MSVFYELKKGVYYDSVTLMRAAGAASSMKGVEECSAIMGTPENKAILKNSKMYAPGMEKASDNDLVIAVKASGATAAEKAFGEIEKILNEKSGERAAGGAGFASLDDALEKMTGANLAVISVAGKYAAPAAEKCLDKNLNVLVFSDNVPVREEIKLKKKAEKKGLLVMGPDCGTCIINGTPLAFANAVKRGDIGVVSAAGTGLQEVSTLISNEGAGISQAIGTGSRDVKKEVGGATFLMALKMLSKDPGTKVLLLVSKPPHPAVLKKIMAEVKKISKPTVAVFLGAGNSGKDGNIIYADNLEDGALKAAYISKTGKEHKAKERIFDINTMLEKSALAQAARKKAGQKYIRALYSGGTYAAETQIILSRLGIKTFSNVPLDKKDKLKNSLKPAGNSVIDLGEDEFTVGRPHPMIDYSLRNKMLVSQSKNPGVAVILLDVVLGYGSNMKPLDDLLPAIRAAFKNNENLSIVGSVAGTDEDPQSRAKVVAGLEKAGVLIMPSNAAAAKLAGEIIRRRHSRSVDTKLLCAHFGSGMGRRQKA